MKTNKPEQISVLLEHDTGVMEVFFTLLQEGNSVVAYPVSSVPRAGSIKPTDRDRLGEALHLTKWSYEHADVFNGVVVRD